MQQQQLTSSLVQIFSLATIMKLVSSLVGGGLAFQKKRREPGSVRGARTSKSIRFQDKSFYPPKIPSGKLGDFVNLLRAAEDDERRASEEYSWLAQTAEELGLPGAGARLRLLGEDEERHRRELAGMIEMIITSRG